MRPAEEGLRLRAAAAAAVRRLPRVTPHVAAVLGSGWGSALRVDEELFSLPYQRIPLLGVASVPGHRGRIRLVRCGRSRVLLFEGRRHWYEGGGWNPVVLPVLIAHAAGAPVLLLTNAAGGLNPSLRPGDLMLIKDHVTAMGDNPLAGARLGAAAPRFPDQSEVYDARLCRLLRACARGAGFPLRGGVYLAVPGPCYETPAEARAFRRLGADAVGMSTVPEAMTARAIGLRVAAVSCVTNRAGGGGRKLTHDEVLAAGRRAAPRMGALLQAFFGALGETR
jgi:purine-nucleoside phosphorylase